MRCTTPGLRIVEVSAGGGADRIDTTGVRFSIRDPDVDAIQLRGGPGDDVLTGGANDELLDGGPVALSRIQAFASGRSANNLTEPATHPVTGWGWRPAQRHSGPAIAL